MGILSEFINIMLHLDKYLNIVITNYGWGAYLILFLLIMCETGLVVTPFLPGDSLLFAAGAFAGVGSLNIVVLILVLYCAAFIGDNANYNIGRFIGPKIFERDTKLFKKEYLYNTQNFYEKHGGKTIIIARFMPIIRTFAPFVAGIGKMKYPKFLMYSMTGGLFWILSLTLCGFFFGNFPPIKNNFTIVIYSIVFISIMPGIISFIKMKLNKKKEGEGEKPQLENEAN